MVILLSKSENSIKGKEVSACHPYQQYLLGWRLTSAWPLLPALETALPGGLDQNTDTECRNVFPMEMFPSDAPFLPCPQCSGWAWPASRNSEGLLEGGGFSPSPLIVEVSIFLATCSPLLCARHCAEYRTTIAIILTCWQPVTWTGEIKQSYRVPGRLVWERLRTWLKSGPSGSCPRFCLFRTASGLGQKVSSKSLYCPEVYPWQPLQTV